MLLATFDQFLGANSKTNPKLLLPGFGANARNLWMESGDFQGIKAASSVHTLTGVVGQQQSIYRMGRDTASDTAYWLAYTTDVDFVRSMLANDSAERTYYTGDGVPKVTDNTYLGAPPYPTGYHTLGVPAPSTAMSAAVGTAGSGTNEDRAYLDTFQTAAGEESAPNASTTSITVPGGSTVNLTSLASVPGGSNGITLRNLYVSTGGEYKRFAQQAAATTTATDTGTRGVVLESGGATSRPAWLEPPSTLAGLIELWNGMIGGFTGKSYCACVPFKPWAWPLLYQKTVPDTIVGTGKWGTNWLLLTTGLPRVVMGASPAALSDQPIYFDQACVSKRSVMGVGHGVVWASNDGLCYYGQLGPQILTEGILDIAAWRALVPSSIIGARWGRYYVGFYNQGGGARAGFMIDTITPRGIVWLDQVAYGVFYDSVTQSLFLLDSGNVIRKWNSGSALSATYKSKVSRAPRKTNAAWAKVVATTYPVTFTLWADGTQIFTGSVTSEEPFRLPSGYIAWNFQVQIQGTGPVEAVMLAEDIVDLI